LAIAVPANFKNDLKAAANKCWPTYDLFRRGAICSLCDSEKTKGFSLKEDEFYFNAEQCTSLITACGDYAKILAEKIYPWFEDVETLSRCMINGKLSTVRYHVDMPFSQNDWNNMVTC
jgi:hypothetical protein